ncbi:hypothetical protein ACSS6W_003311 [Trichoderma asperelloides]
MWTHQAVFSFCYFCNLESFSVRALYSTSYKLIYLHPRAERHGSLVANKQTDKVLEQ